MLRSMTGFGISEVWQGGEFLVQVQVRSTNHRYLEVSVRLPHPSVTLESEIRQLVRNSVSRGRIDVWVEVKRNKDNPPRLKVDTGLAIAYYTALKELAQILGISANLGLSDLIAVPGVLEWDPEDVWTGLTGVVAEAATEALCKLQAMRETEGAKLAQDIGERIRTIELIISVIEDRSPKVVEEYRLRLADKLARLNISQEVNAERIYQEIALMAERCDINEELSRIKSHIAQMKSMVDGSSQEPVGRKLDFLAQEIYREANTIGAKANDADISSRVVELKAEVEKIREQAQNLE
ncbi:MAG: YicC family protein [Clostridia bacterium]|nr:YicC family protein [Clostridia bacterium]